MFDSLALWFVVLTHLTRSLLMANSQDNTSQIKNNSPFGFIISTYHFLSIGNVKAMRQCIETGTQIQAILVVDWDIGCALSLVDHACTANT